MSIDLPKKGLRQVAVSSGVWIWGCVGLASISLAGVVVVEDVCDGEHQNFGTEGRR